MKKITAFKSSSGKLFEDGERALGDEARFELRNDVRDWRAAAKLWESHLNLVEFQKSLIKPEAAQALVEILQKYLNKIVPTKL